MRCRGFTLIELLVVLVIIGLMAGAVSLVVGGNRERRLLEQEAERLTSVLNLARDEAIFEGKVFGFAVDENAYQFKVLNEEATQWGEPDMNALRPHPEPEWMNLELRNDEVTFRLRQAEKEARESPFEPQVVFTPSGEYTPFEITLALKNEEGVHIRIQGDGFNNVERVQDEAGETR